MTAEIAVMNQEAVALAADSAVSGPKIFTSANKIFALSKYHPVAVMVNDSAQFLGVPWETIIKTYRAEVGERSFPTLRDQAAHFLGFFDQANPLFPTAAQVRCNEALFVTFFHAALEHIDMELQERTAQGDDLRSEDITEVASELIKEVHTMWTSAEDLDSLDAAHIAQVTAEYGPLIDRCIEASFEALPLADDTTHLLKEIAVSLVTKDFPNRHSPFHSGLVIAGFGRDEYFPRLYEFELETIILHRLKYTQQDVSETGPEEGRRAVIRAFAQREQVATFMTGIDVNVKQEAAQFWIDRLPILAGSIAVRAALDEPDRAELLDDLLAKCGDAIDEFRANLDQLSDETYVQPIIRVVAMMPKDELAAMAESLVNLTSFKRKVTEEAETVGGPIDVAVISKGDGLVWVKRKHYFAPELNPQFFANYYRGET